MPESNRPDLTEGDRRRTATRRTAEELYRDTAGEIEARDAASRRRMNDDWRKNTRPDIDREVVVFAGDAGEGLYIGRTTDKRQFVKVEKDVLKGVPKDKWRSKICRVVEKLFPKGLEIGNNLINIDHDSKRKLTYSEYSKYMYNNDPGIFGDKMRALNNADEIIKATQNWISEGLKHPRKDDIVDFARGSVLMQIGGRKYYAEVVVGKRKNGKMLLYDIVGLTPTNFTEKVETNVATAENLSPGARRNTTLISNNSISDSAEESNSGFLP